MSYRVIMVRALYPTPGLQAFTAQSRIMYEPKRSEVTSRAYGNCIIPTTHGYGLVCL